MMKKIVFLMSVVLMLVLVFVLPTSAEANIAALVEEQFTSAQEELGMDEFFSAYDEQWDPTKAYWCSWLSTEAFSKEYKKGDSIDNWIYSGNVCIFVPTEDGYSRYRDYFYKDGAWTASGNGYGFGSMHTQGYQDSPVLRKDALIRALEELKLGNVQEVRFLMANWISFCTLVYVKSDTGEYMIPFGCSKEISLVDGELYTVKEVAQTAWRDWYGKSEIARQKTYAKRIALTVALIGLAVTVPLLVHHKKKKAAVK